ncbi:hypothetical protein [Picrophilus oshimae]|nr:hypothetical protein [Picrophilus oshimae]SMD30359.1 hypothetical protein SAMN02745355_0238 [Picrophilus oshimae DSM 9789]
MAEVIVVHTWNDDQKDKVMEFAKKVTDMAKSKKLPAGLKLLSMDLAENKNEAVCKWEVDSINHLLETAKTLGPTWNIDAFEVKETFKKGLF